MDSLLLFRCVSARVETVDVWTVGLVILGFAQMKHYSTYC